MAQTEFRLEIRTPARAVVTGMVSEVVLPAHDGERGILAGHENFVGLLGTGALKFVQNGDDYWFMVSGGLYEVRQGNLVILTEVAEDPKQVDVAATQARVRELESELAKQSAFTGNYVPLKREYDEARARLEAHRRIHMT